MCTKRTYSFFLQTVSKRFVGAPQVKVSPNQAKHCFSNHFEIVSRLTFRTETGTQQYQSYPGE